MPSPRIRTRLLGAAILAFVGAVLAGCGGGAAPDSGASDPGPVHVHAVGVNPADGALFLATHTGLFRTPKGGGAPERVAGRYQDTMGFTVIGPDRFLGSGHPDLREELPSHLGLIESRDAGGSWRSLSLLGEADFHTLRVMDGRVYGYDARGSMLMISSDGGRSWPIRRRVEYLADFVVDPGDARHLIASTEDRLLRSRNMGRSWTALSAGPGLLAWPTAEALSVVGRDGRVRTSADGGASWQRRGAVGEAPAALAASGDGSLIAATHEGRVLSSDDGMAWRPAA